MEEKKEKFMKGMVIFFAIILVGFGIACGGGGGGSAIIGLQLPEGPMYLSQEGREAYDPDADEWWDQWYLEEYVRVDSGIDTTTAVNWDGVEYWVDGESFFWGCYGEDGFVLTIEPDDPEENIARISVAIHNRGTNLAEETWEFMNEDLDRNTFIVLSIMDTLVGGWGSGMTEGESLNFSIFAGGYAQRIVDEGMEEKADSLVDMFYEQIPLSLGISKQQLKEYFRQMYCRTEYVGGEEVTLSQLLEMIKDPANWGNFEFKVRMLNGDVQIIVVENATYKRPNGSRRWARTRKLRVGERVYRGGSWQDAPRFTDIPEEYIGMWHIQTALNNATMSDTDVLVFDLTRPATVYIAHDTRLLASSGLPDWMAGWTNTGNALSTTIEGASPMPIHQKEYPEGTVTLPGLGSEDYAMYVVFVSAGTYDYGLEIISTAHATLIADNLTGMPGFDPGSSGEGGMVTMLLEEGTEMDVAHVEFVYDFDSNVFINSEQTGIYPDLLDDYVDDETEIVHITDVQFIFHLLANNGFRLIDTYNDLAPAFGGRDQILLFEEAFGETLIEPVAIPSIGALFYVFTNMNLLNSPNLVGLYLTGIATDDPALDIWLDSEEPHTRGLNYETILEKILQPGTIVTYFLLNDPETPITLPDLLKQVGSNAEGELSFGVQVEFSDTTTLQIRGGIFNQDYFADVYDALLGDLPFLE